MNATQRKAWGIAAATLDTWLTLDAALRQADSADDDAAYERLLPEALRAEREFDGAWAHYHSI